MAAVLSAVISLATGLAVLPTSVQDAQAQSCVTNGESVIDGGGSTSSESVTIEIEQEQGDIETCSSGTFVTAQSNKGGQTTLNEEEDDYEYDYEYEYEYEYE